jgi:tRNA nucleotidyltransferase (CCA-adding enzyme)
MHIILTHEQADFDALASLLGAHLADEGTIPVLPRKLNRNVRAFITLYGMELPFIDPRDLPNKPIDKVTLVDTQSMISVKGMRPDIQVQVIDHHPTREGIPKDWRVTTEETGATATIYAEVLRERDTPLSTIEATLILLGIYEDTGSLTYTRTTSRDLTAASYLLERGASLEIAGDFLNHPLSIPQQELYDRLRSTASTHLIHGHTVTITCGDAEQMEEELSTVAHKLRDLLDPEGLFVLVTTKGGVQLIARSTNEDIDVARITEHFGGGGHERAAAALIRDLENVCQELLELLPNFIQPAITVAEIMSQEPQLLEPDTPVKEAAERMQRFGYEGYPVVKVDSEGRHQIQGLLTRRAVDRAISHKLNLSAASLMNAGQVSVNPEDSIEILQRLMTESGWGQVPVVHSDSGEVVGIVTRTDLLKILTRQPDFAQSQNLATRLETAIPSPRLSLLKAIAEVAHDHMAALFIVGGFVRDLLLNRPSQDYDLVVEGDAIDLAQALADKYGGRVTSHSRFGTSKWHIADIRPQLLKTLTSETDFLPEEPDASKLSFPANQEELPESIDLITARREFYNYPTALPTVERGSIKLDLHRRDFTINTMAIRLDGHHYAQLHDYWGGLNDLNNGVIRVLHSLSFVDDPTRMLRAVRFEQRFNFQIENRTLELVKGALPLLERVSGDRIRHEIDRIFEEENAHKMLSRLDELNLLTAIQSNLKWDDWIDSRIRSLSELEPEDEWNLESTRSKLHADLGYTLWLIRLTANRARKVIKRLKLSKSLAEDIISAQALWQEIENIASEKPSKIVARLDASQPLAVYANYIACDEIAVREILRDYVFEWQKVVPNTDGNKLRQLGIPPGPIYRQILQTLRNAWLDGTIDSIEDEKSLLRELLPKD